MRLRHAIVSFALTLCLAGSAGASTIGVFFDTAGADCDAAIPPGSAFTFYIIAILGGDAAGNGMTGAEYRVTGADPAWFANYTAGPGSNLALGSPIDGVGANVAWPGCQAPPNGMVLLGTVSGFNPSSSLERVMRVEMRNPPTNVNFPCPLVTLCDLEFTKLCVPGGEASVNRTGPCYQPDAAPATWTQVKGLYTN